MFATSERVSPCSARCSPRSVGRVTRSSSSTCSTEMSRGMRSESSPLGPLTVTRSGSIETVTPEGTGMGCFPIRDMTLTSLPDARHDLATDTLLAGFVAGHDAFRGRDDRGAHAALDAGDVGMVDVGPLAGARDALESGDDGLSILGVLEHDGDLLAGTLGRRVLQRVTLDVSLLLEDAGQLALESRGGNRHVLVLRERRVAQAGEEVGYGIGHRHRPLTNSTWSSRGHIRCARARAGRSGTRRTCDTPSGHGRSDGSAYTLGSCTWASAAGGLAVRSWPCAPLKFGWRRPAAGCLARMACRAPRAVRMTPRRWPPSS